MAGGECKGGTYWKKEIQKKRKKEGRGKEKDKTVPAGSLSEGAQADRAHQPPSLPTRNESHSHKTWELCGGLLCPEPGGRVCA